MTKRYTVAVGHYSLDANALRNNSYRSPTAVFAYDTNSPKQASRVLAELINGKTVRARGVHRQQPIGSGMKFVVMTPDGDYSLRQFRQAFLR
jgi:hypothetical protein